MTFDQELDQVFMLHLGTHFDLGSTLRRLNAIAERHPRMARRKLNLPMLERLTAEYGDRAEATPT